MRSDADAAALSAESVGDLHTVFCDVTKQEDVESLCKAIEQIVDGRLDCLINNAGIALAPGPVEFQEMENIRAQFEVNVFG